MTPMSQSQREPFSNPVVEWIDLRLPVFTMLNKEYGTFPTPRNFNYMWAFGAVAMFILVTMIVTGILLAMHYVPATDRAFASVERIMRDVNYGWLIRYIHMNGASMFFIAVYIHMFRGLYYGSYKKPRELLWIFGVLLLLLMMATAFMGYVLPWGQMSFWGATVITSLFSAIPFVGEDIVHWLWGGFSVDNPTLNRFFALHYLLPFVIVGLAVLHVAALHISGSNNPLGIEPKDEKDTLPFHPYYTTKDSFALTVFLIFFAVVAFWSPDMLGHPDNYIPADPAVTPAHIVPEWYFLPFYAILRSFVWDVTLPFTGIVIVSSKLGGVLLMFGAILMLVLLPWLDRSPVRSAVFRPLYRVAFWLLMLDCMVLGYIGAMPPEGMYLLAGQIATGWYFFHFLVLMPLLGRIEKPSPMPECIHKAVGGRSCGGIGVVAVVALLALSCAGAGAAAASESVADRPNPPLEGWSHKGFAGTYDNKTLRRGYQVYKQVCASCHSMNMLSWRNLSEAGFSVDEAKAMAAEAVVNDGPDETGAMFERKAVLSDRLPRPFPNDQAARAANNGALPPDLSLIVKARQGHEDYIYSLLTGFTAAPPNEKIPDGMYYNPYFAGRQIAMPPPLSDGVATYDDGTKASVDQMAADVTQFLAWAGDPHMEDRKRVGIKILIFLGVLAAFAYALKRSVWRDAH